MLSIGTSIISITISFILSLIGAYILSMYNFKGKTQIELILTLPVVLPPLVLGLSLLVLLGPILGDRFASIGIDFVYTPLGIIMAQFVISFPLMIQVFKNAFDCIESPIIEASIMEGASELEIFRYIIVPMSLSSIISGF